jgi:hypothetical protein
MFEIRLRYLRRAALHALSLHFGEQKRDPFRSGLNLTLQLPHRRSVVGCRLLSRIFWLARLPTIRLAPALHLSEQSRRE